MIERFSGIQEAIAREQEAWLESAKIAGVPVQPLTLARYALLHAAGSPFLSGGEWTAADIGLFLFTVSAERDCAIALRGIIERRSKTLGAIAFWIIRYRFIRRLRKLEAEHCVEEIVRYLCAEYNAWERSFSK